MKGTLFENGVQKGIISDFNVTPAKNIYQDVMGEKVVVGKSNATATFTSPIGIFDPKKSYEVHCDGKVYKIKVTKQIKVNKTRKSFDNGHEVNSVDFMNSYSFPANSNNNVKIFEQKISIDQNPVKRTIANHNNDDQLTKLQGSINRDYKYNEDGELSELTNCFGTTTYQYDSLGNLKKVSFPNGKIVEYKVDAQNRRFKKIINGQVNEYYIWYDHDPTISRWTTKDPLDLMAGTLTCMLMLVVIR